MLNKRIPRMCVTKFSRNVFRALKDVNESGILEITRQSGQPSCFIMSEDEYYSLMETIYVLSDKDVHDAMMNHDKKGSSTYNSAEEALNDCGFYDE